MSTPIAEIINQAYRETNLIPIGVAVTTAEETEGLRRLQSIIKAVIGNEAGEELQAWDVPNIFPNYRGVDMTSPWENSRLMVRLTGALTVDFPGRVRDGARMAVQDMLSNFSTYNLTLDGNGHKIDGAATKVVSTSGYNAEWFFRADLGEWKIITALDIDDEMPFPQEFDELFVALLALRLNPRHGTSTRAETAAVVTRGITRMRARYRQKMAMPSELALQVRTKEVFDDFLQGLVGGN